MSTISTHGGGQRRGRRCFVVVIAVDRNLALIYPVEWQRSPPCYFNVIKKCVYGAHARMSGGGRTSSRGGGQA